MESDMVGWCWRGYDEFWFVQRECIGLEQMENEIRQQPATQVHLERGHYSYRIHIHIKFKTRVKTSKSEQ